jgi:hypothetical protein
MIALPLALTYLMQFTYTVSLVGSIVLFVLIVVFSWLFSIGKWANQHLPENQQKNLTLYTLSLIIPIVYIVLLILVYFPTLNPDSIPQPPSWMFPLHMLSLAGIFYGIWFSAKQYMALLKFQKVNFLIFSSAFFLMFIFPLGIWIIQPSVNKLFDKLDNSKT